MQWLARLYARRIVNVNVNIVLAGLLALPPVVLVVHLVQYLGVQPSDQMTLAIPRLGWSVSFLTVSALTLIADIFFDFSIYLVLHWVANHSQWRQRLVKPAEQLIDAADRGLSFVHDAGIVQFQRAILSPILYGVWLWLQYDLIHRGWSAESATVLGAVAGIATARVLHTFWMLREDKRRRQRAAERAKTAPAPPTAGGQTPGA